MLSQSIKDYLINEVQQANDLNGLKNVVGRLINSLPSNEDIAKKLSKNNSLF
ncbi:hypothetical protein LCM23_13130 [Cytobacillus kochii]|uniref:hypothetical protein n=1 Tax=Cytobacillus kochii TaxID=859143 RepID=UPI001CD4E498|nr:hypothetical protein [Cytobacillus kochii]MCA1027038.1 hypothetical protein [Cytobacillus kochii]